MLSVQVQNYTQLIYFLADYNTHARAVSTNNVCMCQREKRLCVVI